ncbi:MAG: thioredoxin family protein, partial [Acidobacteria bacterium]|nr:thioredoxin family protein [Acidobacteriota bacterium]
PSTVTEAEIAQAIVRLGFAPRTRVGGEPAPTPSTGPITALPEPVARALAEARDAARPVFLDFYAEWCVPCHELERYTFSDERVIEATGPFLTVRADVTDYESLDSEGLSLESEPLRRQFNMIALPTVVFIDAQGNEVQEARVTGYLDPEDLLPLMELALGL